ncbi:MAG: hypothetical protein IKN83_09230 [Bacteroidaceae bacterium]|nr:hypothetical protein [Bacteroidaceae bacterium]
MTDEQVKAKKHFAGKKKTSMKRRDDHHDYTARRMYMITLEVEGRHPFFGRIVGDAFAERGSRDEARIELSALGLAVQREWLGISNHYPQIEVMAVQMMPDHLHGILFVKEPLPVHLGQVISGFKAGCRKAQKALFEEGGFVAVEPQPTEKGTAVSSQGKALPSHDGSLPFHSLFAKGYNDLILRSYDELPVWQNYLRDNPRRLLIKRTRPEWLRPFFGLSIGSYIYSGIGNRQLLTAPKRMAVRVSRRLNVHEIEAEVARYLDAARQGTVLVSPAISPGEKRVMRTAFDAGLPTIVIMENGFTPLSKPKGEQFDACAKGLLLMLAPWEHHNEKQKLSAMQCQQMNLMAWEICNK